MRTSLFLVMISSLVAQIEERSFEERLRESLTNVESLFLQSSSSPIFGASKEKGQLFIGEKGQFRMDYDSGISITSDGNTIVQYDPSTRTATRSVISANLRGHGLWSIVYGQESNLIKQVTQVKPNIYNVLGFGITPKGFPIQLRFGDSYLESIQWVDSSGGTQILSFIKMKPLHVEGRKRLFLALPDKTRWVK